MFLNRNVWSGGHLLLLVTQRTGPLMLGSVEKYCFSVAVQIISDSESSIVD